MMSDFTLISEAIAQETVEAAPNAAEQPSPLTGIVPILLMFAVLYFLLIRPQQKKISDHRKMVTALGKGDKVVTGGGIIGKVVKVDGDDILQVEIADGVNVRVARASISTVLDAASQPANNN